MVGMHWIPDEAIPTSVTVLTLGQQIEYTDLLKANNQSARDWKRIFLCDDQRLARLIERGAHHRCYYHAGLKKDQVAVHEIGGLSDQQIAQEERARDNFARARGLTDEERGALKGDVTATSSAIASAASTKRRGGQSNTFHRGHEENLEAICWLIYHTDGVVVNLAGGQDELGPGAVFFGGNVTRRQVLKYYRREFPDLVGELDFSQVIGRKIPWADLEVRIQLGSMGRKTLPERLQEGAARLEFLQGFHNMLYTSAAIPTEHAKRVFADLVGWPELVELTDEVAVDVVRAAMLEGQAPNAEADMSPGRFMGTGSGQGGQMLVPKEAQRLLPQNSSTQGEGSSSQSVRNNGSAVAVN